MSSQKTKVDIKLQDLELEDNVSYQTPAISTNRKNSTQIRNEPAQVSNPIVASRESIVSNGSLNTSKIKRNSLITNEKNKSLSDAELGLDQRSNKSLIKKDREIAGFSKQFAILSWKNLILSKRNVCGLVTEILCPIFTIVILLVIRYFVDASIYTDQSNTAYNVLDLFPITINTTNTTMLLYYPNNAFIQGIINQSVALIKLRKPFFNVTGLYIYCFFWKLLFIIIITEN